MSQVEYARHRGVSKQAVGKMIANNKIPVTFRDGRKRIDPAAADFALGENLERVDAGRDYPDLDLRPDVDKASTRSSSSGLTRAKTVSETYRAKIAELEYNERVGELLPIRDVQRAMERCAEMLVREVDQLPVHADDLATAFTRGGVAALRDALKERARGLRQTLSDNMRLTAAAEDDEDE